MTATLGGGGITPSRPTTPAGHLQQLKSLQSEDWSGVFEQFRIRDVVIVPHLDSEQRWTVTEVTPTDCPNDFERHNQRLMLIAHGNLNKTRGWILGNLVTHADPALRLKKPSSA